MCWKLIIGITIFSSYKIRLNKGYLVQLSWILGKDVYEIGTETRAMFYDIVTCQGTSYVPQYYTSIPSLFRKLEMVGLHHETV